MVQLVGRAEEQGLLDSAYLSDKPEFIALYGRRRVGKTFLVRNTFSQKKDCLFFYVTGIKDGELQEQLANMTDEIAKVFGYPQSALEIKKGWRETFRILTDAITASKSKKIVLFFDEFPWMVTRKSRLLQMLEYFWNRHWSMDKRIKLIICGSASGWILKNIVNNTGGLYNRATHVLHLEPFNLSQTKQYLKHAKITATDKEIAHLYMVIGGIPFYLDQLKRGLSAIQNVEHMAFTKDSFLLKEFSNLYATLFGPESAHIEIARIIAQHCYGIGQKEIITQLSKVHSGGRIVKWLADLEQAGFIMRFIPFGSQKKGIFYKMIDEYSLFYFNWIEPQKGIIERGITKGYWVNVQNSPAWHSWAGCAFESLCNKHVLLVSQTLNIGYFARPYSWRFVPKAGSKEKGAQIDLLFDRDDRAITICEIKYTEQPYSIDKAYAQKLLDKVEIFKKHTKTDKSIFLAMISSGGIKHNAYSQELISSVVTLADLLKSKS